MHQPTYDLAIPIFNAEISYSTSYTISTPPQVLLIPNPSWAKFWSDIWHVFYYWDPGSNMWFLMPEETTNRGPHQDLSDFLYSGSTDENQWILFYFQLYALEQRSWMVLKLFLFSENYFLVKIFVFFGHTYLFVFSNLGQFLEINYVFFNIYILLYCTL